MIRLGKVGEKIIMANLKKISIAKLNIALGCIATIAAVVASPLGNPALAEPLAFATPRGGFSIVDRVLREPASPQRSVGSAQDGAELPAHLRRQVVDFRTTEAAGTIIVDTPNTYLYYVLGGGKAIRYGIGVGREGFTWSGVQTIARKAEWPDSPVFGGTEFGSLVGRANAQILKRSGVKSTRHRRLRFVPNAGVAERCAPRRIGGHDPSTNVAPGSMPRIANRPAIPSWASIR
jgi:hypothetical protein